jgi:hypothetical protein
MLPRAGALSEDHAGNAAAAASAACAISCAEPLEKSATRSSVLAGLRFSKVWPLSIHYPLM